MRFDFISHGKIDERQLDHIAEIKATVWPYHPAEHRRWMIDNLISDDLHLLLYKGDTSDTLIGYLTLNSIEVDGKPCLGIGNVCIHSEFHGKGLGLLLMKLAESYILTIHSDAWLLCKPTVAPFYERCGWIPVEGDLIHNGEIINCRVYKMMNTSPSRIDINQPQCPKIDGEHCINRIF